MPDLGIKEEAIAKALRFYSNGDVKQSWVKSVEEEPNGKVKMEVETTRQELSAWALGNSACLEALRDTKELLSIFSRIGEPTPEIPEIIFDKCMT